jgi:hypothetical protein
MMEARAAGGHAMAAARDLRGAARNAAYAAGQAGAVAHVAAHELGAAAYAIKAARAAAPEGESAAAGRLECQWQRDQLPEAIRDLVLDDQRLRNDICWSVFECWVRTPARTSTDWHPGDGLDKSCLRVTGESSRHLDTTAVVMQRSLASLRRLTCRVTSA